MTNRMSGLLSVKLRCGLRFGRLAVLLSIVALAALAQGCTQVINDDLGDGGNPSGGIVPPVQPTGPMAADVRVVSDPQGGSFVSELSCVFEVTEVPGSGPNPIVITVSWVAACGTHKTEAFVFDGGTQTFESIYSENGRAIAMTFWTTITWQDALGRHQIQSGFAACTG